MAFSDAELTRAKQVDEGNGTDSLRYKKRLTKIYPVVMPTGVDQDIDTGTISINSLSGNSQTFGSSASDTLIREIRLSHAPSAAASICTHGVDVDTVALWQLDGDLLDESANSFDLSETGTVAYDARSCGSVTESLRGDATNYATHPYDAALAITGELTIMAFVKINVSAAGNNTIVTFMGPDPDSNSANNILYRLVINADKLNYLAEYGAGLNTSATPSTSSITRNQYEHVAMTRSASGDINFYINGVDAGGGGATTTPTGGSNAYLLVGRTISAGNDLEGNVSSLIIKDVEMTPAEVLAAYEGADPDTYLSNSVDVQILGDSTVYHRSSMVLNSTGTLEFDPPLVIPSGEQATVKVTWPGAGDEMSPTPPAGTVQYFVRYSDE